MAQSYPDIPSSDQLVASRQKILDRDEALRSSFSGTTQPSSPVVGQFWLDTDESPMKLYQCVQITPSVVFREIPFGTLSALATANPAALVVDLIATTQTAWRVPTGADTNRPGTPQEGMIRGSTTQGAFEGYISGAWRPIGAGFSNAILNGFVGNGSTTAFTLSSAPGSKNNCRVVVDGVVVLDKDFSLSDTTLTLASAPPAPSIAGQQNVNVVYSVPLSIGTPADGTVTAGKIASGFVLPEFRIALGAGTNINLAVGSYFSRTITGATTLTVSSIPTAGNAASFILDLTNGGSASITWFANVRWPNGVAPTLTASGRDVLGFFTHDGGGNWTGLVLGRDVK